MSDLSSIEKNKLENMFDMKTGYVLNWPEKNLFSNNTFKAFILDSTRINIYEKKYGNEGESKAKRLRSFWQQESNYIVGKLILDLLEFWKDEKSNNGLMVSLSEQSLFDECFQISQRLMQDGKAKDVDEFAAIKAHFNEEIAPAIIEQIELAKFIIWVAVAWFTDRKLFEKLLAKKNEGVNVQLIIIDDDINRNSGLKYEELETYKIPKIGTHENIMHNKFCIIDLKTVIHGSYNWTQKARFNKEAITIVDDQIGRAHV